MSPRPLLLGLLLAACSAACTTGFSNVPVDARGAIGASQRLGDGNARTNLSYELGATGRIALGDHSSDFVPGLLPEISFIGRADDTDDALWATGFGMGFLYRQVVLGVVPGFVWGCRGSDMVGSTTDVFGTRLMAIAELRHIVGVQVSYLLLSGEGNTTHDFSASASLNLIPLIIFFGR